MDRLPHDCQELIARMLMKDTRWTCDTIAETANIALIGNGGFTELCHTLQDVLEPGCKSKDSKNKNKNKHFFLSEKSKWAHQSAKVEKRRASLMDDPDGAQLIEYSWRAKFVAERYAATGNIESLEAFNQMRERMKTLKSLLAKSETLMRARFTSTLARGTSWRS